MNQTQQINEKASVLMEIEDKIRERIRFIETAAVQGREFFYKGMCMCSDDSDDDDDDDVNNIHYYNYTNNFYLNHHHHYYHYHYYHYHYYHYHYYHYRLRKINILEKK